MKACRPLLGRHAFIITHNDTVELLISPQLYSLLIVFGAFIATEAKTNRMRIMLMKLLSRIQLSAAAAKCIAVLLSYLLGSYMTGHIHDASPLTGAMLACTSSIVVLQQVVVKDSIHQGWLRIVGTFIGAVIAYLYLIFFPFTVLGMVVTVFLLEIICMLLAIPDNGKMATITLIVILIVSKQSPDLPPLTNGLLRFSEAAIGVGIGVMMVWVQNRLRNLNSF